MNDADYWIEKLNLELHPEGGYFREVYRSDENIAMKALPDRYNDNRSFSTSIYFLLKGEQISSFHRIKSDETWHFYQGTTLKLFIIGIDGTLTTRLLGNKIEEEESLQITIPRNNWFGGKVVDKNSFALLGCTVAPGFHFDDFELAEKQKLINKLPKHKDLIEELTIN